MLIPAISDSYRGVKISVGFAADGVRDIYCRLEFVDDKWNSLLEEMSAETLAGLLHLGGAEYRYDVDHESSGHHVFIWFAKLVEITSRLSMFSILNDIFNRIDIIAPCPRGVGLHVAIKDRFKKFLKEYAFVDEKKTYTNGAELVPMFRVLDALDMIESGNFSYGDAHVAQSADAEIGKSDTTLSVADKSEKQRNSKSKKQKTAKIGTTKGK